ncbi:GNAT family N-acetyltransferase [Bacillus sp. ISL-35]|uniref:GNAT family N-acetyltransferase n=1 Tax=Bacillus sp. ISL-35 TaxID=2819122 RepID=UPI001BE882F8|nr:GNAT family N-acetyltransferase [Bacillus sp. ISL-35]MBT2681759.1 GNAT family N-acetyltransferase [Bacillus sp. ISL-35]MBT2706056.1 GNAT family N-acetyltransferase [Chryseobacterium sp. ISL-80]
MILTIKYLIYNSLPSEDVLNELNLLHSRVFNTSEDLAAKMANKPQLLIITAMAGTKLVGYKIGYELKNDKFYSWLGGVNPAYRGYGIASALMKRQHQYLMERGYRVVQTKTMNKWRAMLILNLKNGFDVIDTYIDEKGLHKIKLEKQLISVKVDEEIRVLDSN